MRRRIVWIPEGASTEDKGFSLFYPAIAMHAVSRDVSDFHSPCLYLQLDAEQSFGFRDREALNGPEVRLRPRTLGGARFGWARVVSRHTPNRSRPACPACEQAALPMDTGNVAGAAEGHVAEEEDGEEEDGKDDAADEDDTQEVRLVPVDVGELEGGLDGALDRLFQALSEGAALNPDEEESESEEEGGFDMSGFYTAE